MVHCHRPKQDDADGGAFRLDTTYCGRCFGGRVTVSWHRVLRLQCRLEVNLGRGQILSWRNFRGATHNGLGVMVRVE